MKTTLLALLLLATAVQADMAYIQELDGPTPSSGVYTIMDDGVIKRYIPTTGYANDRPGYIIPSNGPNTRPEGITQPLHPQHEDLMQWHENP